MSAESEMERELTEHEVTLLLELIQVREQLAALDEAEAKLKSQLATSLDTHTHGLLKGTHVVTVSRSRPERFDLAQFRVDHELLASAYMKPSKSETVRVMPRKGARDAIIRAGVSILEA